MGGIVRVRFVFVAVLTVILLASGCLGGYNKGSTATSMSSNSSLTPPSPTSSTTETKTTSLTTTTPPAHTSSSAHITTSPNSLTLLLGVLGRVTSYSAVINTSVNSLVQIMGGGVTRVENVSVFSNATAFYNLASGSMEINMTIVTEPAGSRVFTQIVLSGNEARVFSLGQWNEFTRGEQGFSVIEETFESNPVSLVLAASKTGTCTLVPLRGGYKLSCFDRKTLEKLVKSSVGTPEGAKVEVRSGKIELVFQDSIPVGGSLEVEFLVSTSYTDASGRAFELVQRGSILETFSITSVGMD